MTAWLRKQLRGWRRWREADRKGWGLAGQLFGLRAHEADGFRAHWLVRNPNRLYRLTRGYGNPWKPANGF